jgi:hypothetical protein
MHDVCIICTYAYKVCKEYVPSGQILLNFTTTKNTYMELNK